MSIRPSRLGFLAVALSCAAASSTPTALDRYDVRASAATQTPLPEMLREVSDLALTDDGRMLAVQDETGVVFEVDVRRGTIVKRFALAPAVLGDFEGLTVVDGRIFMLTATGQLYETREGADRAGVPYTLTDTGLRRQCEFEGLTYEPTSRSLILACKTPHARELRGSVTLYRWSLEQKALATPARISAPLADVMRGVRGKAFSPSAVARMSETGNFVVLAGRQGLIAEITPAGAVVGTRALERRLHPQPEGIAFLGDSLLVISDEGGKGRGTLTLYPRAK
ncbi:MAG TPA: SdiA-regulated domain-containing protein [Gemmatimonadaceae bacterium]|jgi:uncharacterized protein YjiK|nr:SdiA-regulated domain-containing protein [Gemmatimonadaceae bacterium]